jgi:PAS domain S-box-containing protein
VETIKTKGSEYARSLIEASLDPLVTISSKGKIMDMNQALCNITGLSRGKLTGTDFLDYFTEPEKARAVYQIVFANGSVADSPLTLKHKSGALTDVLFNGSVYKDDVGNVLGVVIVARDVTDQKRIATELKAAMVIAEIATGVAEDAKVKADVARKLAEDAVKAKQQFLSNMSHEIRTPMNAIIGFTKVILKTELTAKQTEYLTAIKTSGDALIVLINDILDLAKVDAGKMVFEETPFKMALSISAMLHLFEPKIHEKNIRLIKKYDEQIPEVLLGDPVRLHQIILNLLSNAVKFTKRGTITVSIRLVEKIGKTVKIEFVISDTGIGISDDKMATIFENFQQASSDTSRLFGGTGLGLAIVKQLVEAQGGSINVTSVFEQGSDFCFTLNFQTTDKTTESDAISLTPLDMIKNVRILVVEDIALNQLLVRTLLDDFGFGCDIASNGKIAIEKLKTNTYDVILMDLQMPEMNGFEATEFIRKNLGLKIPIIALTADVTTSDLAKCRSVGMDDYISKPVDERLLQSKIISMLTRSPQSNGSEPMMGIQLDAQKTPYIDLNYLQKRTKDNTQLMIEMITLYLSQTSTSLQEMQSSTMQKDWKKLHATAHKLIPSFSIVGIRSEFADLAKELQEMTRAGESTEGIESKVNKLTDILQTACEELEVELTRIKTKEL